MSDLEALAAAVKSEMTDDATDLMPTALIEAIDRLIDAIEQV